jgi:hypothetical protein
MKRKAFIRFKSHFNHTLLTYDFGTKDIHDRMNPANQVKVMSNPWTNHRRPSWTGLSPLGKTSGQFDGA